jgi:putative endonuclease
MDCAVYIMTNRHRTVLYVGVTSNLTKRLAEHRAKIHPSSFTNKYNIDQLVTGKTNQTMGQSEKGRVDRSNKSRLE